MDRWAWTVGGFRESGNNTPTSPTPPPLQPVEPPNDVTGPMENIDLPRSIPSPVVLGTCTCGRSDDESTAAADRPALVAVGRARGDIPFTVCPVARRVRSWRKLHVEWGSLKDHKCIETSPTELHVLVRAEGEGVWKSFRF
jgi:hypothetical protein